jgi:gliding motility-associated-like protein
LCFEICDGVIDLALSGGYGGYQVSWAEVPETTASISDLCSGDYTYTITDSEGCTATAGVTLVENPAYFIADVEVIPGACFGENSGTINVSSPEAVLFDLNAGAITNGTGVFTNLEAGEYTLLVTDAFGCQADSTVSFINASTAIDLTVDFETLTICVGDDVVFGATATGGDGNFNYAWYANAGATDLVSNNNPLNWVAQDSLTLFVVATDGFGCDSDTLSASIGFQDPLTIDLGPLQNIEICENECIDLFAQAEGGNGNSTIEWTSSLTGETVIATGAAANLCPPGTLEMQYVATVSDGCVAPTSDTVFVFIYNQPLPLIGYDVSEGCFPVTVNFENLTDSTFFGNCEWALGDGNTLAACTDLTYTYGSPGTYTPSLTVTSPFGCVGTSTLDVPIEVSNYPIADFSWSPQLTSLQTTLQYENRSSGEATYEWTFDGIGTSDEENPTVSYPSVDASTWLTCLKVTNLAGCADSICYFINMQSEVLIYVPNAFTPDDDNLNELFYPVIGGGISTQDYNFSIWNRWGEKLFETDQFGEGWNGSVNRGEYYVEAEAYIWKVVYRETDSGDKRELKGHVILVR